MFDYDPATGAFTLPDEMALVIATDDSPASLIGVFGGFAALWSDLGTIEGFFRAGGGMGWGDHHPALNDAQSRFTRPMYRASLVGGWIAALDGVTSRPAAGGRVADIGCGQGTSTILMAEEFPASAFAGFDHGDALVATARRAAADAGVADRVSFEVADATRFPGTGYDLVTFTDCLHDLGDPVAAAAHARSALAPGGTVMVVEPLAADRLEDDFTNPYARIGYAISTLVCTPSSLAQPGAAALGAMAGETRLRQVLADGRRTPACAASRRRRLRSTSCWRPGHERAAVSRCIPLRRRPRRAPAGLSPAPGAVPHRRSRRAPLHHSRQRPHDIRRLPHEGDP